jgi:hypothetical protein
VSLWTELRDAIREVLLLREQLTRALADIDRLQSWYQDHDRRITRMEAFFELAKSQRLPPSH